MRSAAARRTPRSGFVLPFVIIVMVMIGALSLAAVATSWRGYRAARVGANGVRAQFAADEAIALQLDTWPDDSLTTMPLGTTLRGTWATGVGDRVEVHTTRTQPLVAFITSDVQLGRIGTLSVVRRHITRAIHFDSPSLPIQAALTSLAVVIGSGATSVTGVDAASASDACGSARDTASVPDVTAIGVEEAAPGSWSARPTWMALPDSAETRAKFEKAWVQLVARSHVQVVGSEGVTISPLPGWHSLLLPGASVTMHGPSRWRGIISITGDLVITGRVDIDGVLVVRGQLDVRAGELHVHGALLVASLGKQTTQLGGRTYVHYNRCAEQMALATVAEPHSRPFALWYSPPN